MQKNDADAGQVGQQQTFVAFATPHRTRTELLRIGILLLKLLCVISCGQMKPGRDVKPVILISYSSHLESHAPAAPRIGDQDLWISETRSTGLDVSCLLH